MERRLAKLLSYDAQNMSPWTKFLDGGDKKDSRQLLPDSDHPEVHRGQDVDHSAQAASSQRTPFLTL